MGILDYFTDWQLFTGDFYESTTLKDATGAVNDVETLLQSSVQFALMIDKTVQDNIGSQFVNNEVGVIYVDPSTITFTPTKNTYVMINSIRYNIEGVNDINGFGEAYELTYTRERKN